jgi:hypothetical protein
MRCRPWLQLSLTLAASFAPLSSLAQFQPPTQEELQMKSEPKAPGAAAIYLYREETVDDNLHYHSFYARIKVLTEKGKELATQSIPYIKNQSSITDIKARTIHADGTIIPLDVKPSDLVEQKAKDFQVNKIVFTLPSVEVGSILEYRWQLRYDDSILSSPDWDIQQPYFVRKAHYMFYPFGDLSSVTSGGEGAHKLMYSAIMLPEHVEPRMDARGKYTIDITDVPPIPQEEYMPPLETMIQQVKFYYSPFSSKEEFWQHRGQKWSREMDHFAEETKTIKEATSTIVGPGDSEEQKARKVYDAVMALDNTDYTRRKSKEELKTMGLKVAKQAEDIWKQKSGSSDQLALLYLAMARSAGLKAYAVLVCNRNHNIMNQYFMSMDQFDDVLVVVSINGKDQYLDPGKKFAPFGQLDWRHSLVGAMRQQDKGTSLGNTPGNNVKEAVTFRVANITVAKDGSISGTVRISMNGPTALHWRELSVENDEDEVKKRFNEEMKGTLPDGVTADFDHFLALDDYHSQLMGIVKISGNMGNVTGKHIFLPGVFFESHAKHPFVSAEKRSTAVDMRYSEMVQDEVTYNLPVTYKVESSPAATTIPWEKRGAFGLKATVSGDSVTVDRVFVRGFSYVNPNEYDALRDFYQKVAAADQQQLVLTAAPATVGAGN